jgi:hypothetical protein
MNSTLLEELEAFRLKVEKTSNVPPELIHQHAILLSAITASIEALTWSSASIAGHKKRVDSEINELIVYRNFLNQIVRIKQYGNNSVPGESDGSKR